VAVSFAVVLLIAFVVGVVLVVSTDYERPAAPPLSSAHAAIDSA
jgi:hypothetical protein